MSRSYASKRTSPDLERADSFAPNASCVRNQYVACSADPNPSLKSCSFQRKDDHGHSDMEILLEQ
jgi:hypothetical protein